MPLNLQDIIKLGLVGSGSGGSSGGGGGGGEKSPLDALIDGSITEISSDVSGRVRNYAFAGAANLQRVNLPRAEVIGYSAFLDCYALVSANIPAATKIEGSVFKNCKALKKMTCPNVTTILASTFFDCESLTIIDFHQRMSFPSAYVFGSSSSEYVPLNALLLRSNTLCELKGTSFFYCTGIKNGTSYIYVPRALVDTYKTATNWSTYADQFRALEDYTVDGTITGELDESKI